MSRESIYKRYIPADSSRGKTGKKNYWLIFKDDQLLVTITKDKISIPITNTLEELITTPIRKQYLGTLKGHPVYSVEADTGTIAPEGMAFRGLKSLHEFLDEDIYLLAGKAIQIITWDRNHQFCGRCGASTETSEYEIAKVCPECGLRSYARLSPAVINAIIKDGKILMAKHGYRRGMYSLIAGFVEPGETLEEAVARETMEEVGLKVKNIKYFSSQPWPYPHSLMVAFKAEYESGEIKVDGKEITDAGWFSPNNIPRIPSKLSIARELIEWFIEKFS